MKTFATIEFSDGTRCTIDHAHGWTGDDPAMATALQRLHPFIEQSPADGIGQIVEHARKVAAKLGADLVDSNVDESESERGRIY